MLRLAHNLHLRSLLFLLLSFTSILSFIVTVKGVQLQDILHCQQFQAIEVILLDELVITSRRSHILIIFHPVFQGLDENSQLDPKCPDGRHCIFTRLKHLKRYLASVSKHGFVNIFWRIPCRKGFSTYSR